ncbi:iron hydrogenase small subunit [bacterium]|nr:iron hydrogenase small subunit [bacterium]
MACPEGCIGGGGQPKSKDKGVIEKRKEALYKIDDDTKVRMAHRNPLVIDFFENYLSKLTEEEKSGILHTSFKTCRPNS